MYVLTIIDCYEIINSFGILSSGFPARNRNFSIYIEITEKQRFCGSHLGLQDGRQEYKFENVSIAFANLKNVYLDTKISIV